MNASKKGVSFRVVCSCLVYIGLLGMGLWWLPVVGGIVLLAYEYIGWGWALVLMVPMPLAMVLGGAMAWIAGGMGRSTL